MIERCAAGLLDVIEGRCDVRSGVVDVVGYGTQHQILDAAVDDGSPLRRDSLGLLERYFAPGSYTGAHFNSFAADANARDEDVITSDDVVAVKMLSVDIGARACLRLIEEQRDEIYELLREVPHNPIYEVERDIVSTSGKATKLWTLLQDGRDGVGWVTAGKLLARKRPHLIPVYDSVVRAALQAPKSVWMCMWEYFHGVPERVTRWAALRDEAGVTDQLSVLRTIDVVLWMRGQDRR